MAQLKTYSVWFYDVHKPNIVVRSRSAENVANRIYKGRKHKIVEMHPDDVQVMVLDKNDRKRWIHGARIVKHYEDAKGLDYEPLKKMYRSAVRKNGNPFGKKRRR